MTCDPQAILEVIALILAVIVLPWTINGLREANETAKLLAVRGVECDYHMRPMTEQEIEDLHRQKWDGD